MLPLVAPWIRYATVYLDDENDEVTARVMKQIPNLRWLVFDCRLQNYSPQAVSVLRNLSSVTRLSIYSCSPQLMSTLAANVQLLQAFGSKLKSLYVYCDWSSSPPEKLFHAIRDHVPSLESIYVFSTRNSLVADLFVLEPGWSSRETLKDAHFEECTEMDAWVVANMVRRCPVLLDLIISSCGGPGEFGETVHDATELC